MTVTAWPATVSVAVRDEVEVLAAMLYATEPFPLPLAPLVMVIHVAVVVAVQAHPVPAVTVTDAVPAPAIADWVSGLTV